MIIVADDERDNVMLSVCQCVFQRDQCIASSDFTRDSLIVCRASSGFSGCKDKLRG